MPSSPPTAAVVYRTLTPADVPAVSDLHSCVFGPGRFARTAYRVREGTPAISRFCRGAFAGERLIACLRLTEVTIGGAGRHLLLGPLAVVPDYAGQGFGKALVSQALDEAAAAGIETVVLVGDLPYYDRFGFVPVGRGQIALPGPVDPSRLLARELKPGALAVARGAVAPAPR